MKGNNRRARAEFVDPAAIAQVAVAGSMPATLRGVGEQALVAVRRWADPRERELRRRRRVRRRSFQLGTASGITTVGAVGLAVISAPAWAVVVIGGGAIAFVTGTALSARRYLELRNKPLPQAAFVARKSPGLRSAARAPIQRLIRAERALYDLGAQIARTRRLPEDELRDLLETARSGAAALHALATDVVAMEQAADTVGRANPDTVAALKTTVAGVLARLETGVIEYEQLVAAAARILAVPEDSVLAYQFNGIVADLREAADRLDGWAQALTEMADQGPDLFAGGTDSAR
ncbi:phage shock envelope stress response protein PspM [Nocardia fluminea]|uniref:phage shock envelope stress response protein PspM n=1 Tax=Nocardia fluminea TaxID=134984 RepID=UPI0033FC016E